MARVQFVVPFAVVLLAVVVAAAADCAVAELGPVEGMPEKEKSENVKQI